MASPATASYLHRGGDCPLIGTTLDVFVRNVGRNYPDRDAIVCVQQKIRLTYAQLDERVEELARGLLALGVERGDRVAIWSTDNVEWVVLQFAAARVGAILVNINPAYRSRELEHALRLARVEVMFLIPAFRSSDYVGMMRALCPTADTCDPDDLAAPGLEYLRHVVVYDPTGPTDRPGRGFLTWRDVIERGRTVTGEQTAARTASLDPDDPVNIQFTSGTTGAPKAVVLTHHNIVNNGFACGEAMHFTEADRLCVPVPFYHCFGMVVSNIATLSHGAALVIPSEHFDAGGTLAAIDRERCTAVHGVPSMFVAELEREDFDTYDLSSLRTGIMGGAPCPPALLKRVMSEMGCREILIAYGQTESSPLTHLTHPDDTLEHRTQTVGLNMPHQETKVVDPNSGAIVRRGEPGEVCFRGYHVMRGYYDQPDVTREAIDEAGWLHSGDLGVMQPDGRLRITGRLKDMIIRGGENIYPAEVEAFYHEHPKVAQIAVCGVPDERLGEEVVAFVMLHNGMTSDADELRRDARDRIAYYKIPRHFFFVDEFPMTVSGKIQKFRLREIGAQRLAALPA